MKCLRPKVLLVSCSSRLTLLIPPTQQKNLFMAGGKWCHSTGTQRYLPMPEVDRCAVILFLNENRKTLKSQVRLELYLEKYWYFSQQKIDDFRIAYKVQRFLTRRFYARNKLRGAPHRDISMSTRPI